MAMSLPPGFLDELRSRLSIGQVVGRKGMWDTRKSNQGKGDLWASCPFHQEKSASFHVDDRKGFYYCFGCHAKGDAITFVRETENVSFMEAVQILAGEAGMPMPERDPRAQEKSDRRAELVEVMEQAVQWHRLQLQTAAAGDARDYLMQRGLSPEAQARWEIGFAPDRGGVLAQLTGKGVSQDKVIEAGLAAKSDRGGAPYDRFRGRIIFPIRDARGRAIGLGGRAMAADARAKYLNSPETPLFDKGRSLYNHAPAREAAGKGQPLIVAEGYMDVIALSEAGFTSCVAPLGTAITEDQLRLMWRVSPEPVITLDGDLAGQRAAMRVIDLALPLLEAGQSVRFAMMPDGQDPDDLIKAAGAGAMREKIDGAMPMVNLLWQREIEGKSFDSPERKDPSIRSHYGQAIKDMRGDLFGSARPQQGGTRRSTWTPKGAKLPAQTSTKASALAGGTMHEDQLREAVILAVLIKNPLILNDFYSALERMRCSSPDTNQVRDAVLRMDASDGLETQIAEEIGSAALESLFAQAHVAITPAVRRPDNGDLARMCLAEEFAKLTARRGHVHEVEDAIEELSSDVADERLTARLAQSAGAMNGAGRQDNDDSAEYDTSGNGARIKKDERSAFDALLDKIDFAKGGRGT